MSNKVYQKRTKEEQLEYNRERGRQWREKNPVKYKECMVRGRERRKERIKNGEIVPLTDDEREAKREYHRQWRAKNPDKLKAATDKHKQKRRILIERFGLIPKTIEQIEKNRLIAKAYREQCRERRKTDPEFRAREIEWGKQYRQSDKGKLRHRHGQLRQYGITPEQYDEMFAKQNGVCAICKQSETWKSPNSTIISALTVDHDHITGKVRGLLCRSCNGGLGRLGDNLESILEVVKYLQQPAAQ